MKSNKEERANRVENNGERWQWIFGIIVFGGGMIAFLYVLINTFITPDKEFESEVDRLQDCYDSARSPQEVEDCEFRFFK